MSKRARGEQEIKEGSKDLVQVSTTTRYHPLLKNIPTKLVGQMFEFLNFYETFRFLYATGRLGQDYLKDAYKSQLVVNLFRGRTNGGILIGGDWPLLISATDETARALSRISPVVRVLRIHMGSTNIVQKQRLPLLLASRQLAIIDIRLLNDDARLFPDILTACTGTKPRLREFRWINASAFTGSDADAALKKMLAETSLLEILHLRYMTTGFVDESVLQTMNLPRLRFLQCPVFEIDPKWLLALAAHCPLMQEMYFTTRTAIAGWYGLCIQENAEEIMSKVFNSLPHLICVSSYTDRDSTDMLWKRETEQEEWNLSFQSGNLEDEAHQLVVLKLIAFTPKKRLKHLKLTGTEKPRQLQNILTEFMNETKEHKHPLQIQSLELTCSTSRSHWPDSVYPWISDEQLKQYRDVWVPRGLNRLHLQIEHYDGPGRELLVEKDMSSSGSSSWKLKTSGIHMHSFRSFLETGDKWFPLSEIDYNAIGAADASSAPGFAVWKPWDMYEYMRRHLWARTLQKWKLGGGLERVHTRLPWYERKDLNFPPRPRPDFGSGTEIMTDLRELDLGPCSLIYGSGLFGEWVKNMPHLTSIAATFRDSVVPRNDWLVWHNKTSLRFRDGEGEDEKKHKELLLDDETLARLLHQNPQLETLWLDLNHASLKSLDCMESKTLTDLYLRLDVESIQTAAVLRLRKRCPKLAKLKLTLLDQSPLKKGILRAKDVFGQTVISQSIAFNIYPAKKLVTESADIPVVEERPFLLEERKTTANKHYHHRIHKSHGEDERDKQTVQTTELCKIADQMHQWNVQHPPDKREQDKLDQWARQLVQDELDKDLCLAHKEMEYYQQVRRARYQCVIILPPSPSCVIHSPDLWQQQLDAIQTWQREHRSFTLLYVDENGKESKVRVSGHGRVSGLSRQSCRQVRHWLNKSL